MVGRQDQVNRLLSALEDVRAGNCRVVLVEGEAGIGKSRLISEFVGDLDDDVRVLIGRCTQLSQGAVPFGALADALSASAAGKDLAAGEAPEGTDATLLRVFADDVERMVPEDAETTPPATGRVIVALTRFLSLFAAQRQCVLVIEDIQWSDASTREFLLHVARAERIPHLMIVLSVRTADTPDPTALRQFVGELRRARTFVTVALRPLSIDATAAQVGAILGRNPARGEVRRIFDRSEGNPFYSEELLAVGFDDALSPALSGLLLARFASSDLGTQELLRLAAVIGREFDERILKMIHSGPKEAVEVGLRDAARNHLLLLDHPADGRHSFRHALLHEAVYNDLMASERRRAHLLLARSLEDRPDLEPRAAQRLALIAVHYHAAGDDENSLRASVDAALAADAVLAYRESLAHYERALFLYEAGIEPVAVSLDIGAIYEKSATAARLAQHTNRAVMLGLKAVRHVEDEGDRARLASVLGALSSYQYWSGDADSAAATARRAVDLIPPDPPSLARARALAALGMVLQYVDRREALAVTDETIRVARSVGAPREEACGMTDHGINLALDGRLSEAKDMVQRAFECAAEHDQREAIRALTNLAWILGMQGQNREAAETAMRGYQLATEHGLQHHDGLLLLNNAIYSSFLAGEVDTADHLLERARDLADDATPQGSLMIFWLRHTQAEIAVMRGDFAAAESELDDLARSAGDHFAGAVTMVQAQLALWREDLSTARAHAESARAAKRLDGHVRMRLSHLLLWIESEDATSSPRRGRSARARAAEGRADEIVNEARLMGEQGAASPHLLLLLQVCASEHDRLSARFTPELWQGLGERWRSISDRFGTADHPFDFAFCRWRAAEAELNGRGSRARAVADIRAAMETADRLGARPLAAALRSLATRARIDLETTPRAQGGDGVTRRELEVLSLLGLGRTNREIAATLFISEKTAGVHVSNLLGKLGVSNRTEAVSAGLRMGLIGARPE